MAKGKKDLHACDKERKKQNKKDLKRNAVKRKEHKEVILKSMDPASILSEIYRINRAEVAGTSDEKMLIKRKQLIAAHKAAVAKAKEVQEKKNQPEEEQITIKGLSKIFKSIKNKAAPEESGVLALTHDGTEDALMEDNEDTRNESVADKENITEGEKIEDATKETEKGGKQKKGVVFSQAEEESMVFDESLIEELILEVPPGVKAPPGIRGVPRPPGTPLMTLGTNSLFGRPPIPHIMHPGAPHHPAQLVQHALKLSETPLGPTIPFELKPKPSVQDNKSLDPLDPSAKKKSEISSGPSIASLPSGSTAPKLAFVPTSLLVKSRAPAPFRRAQVSKQANKMVDEREVATRKKEKKADKSSTTAEAYDEFMQVMDAMGAFEEDSD